MPLSQRFDCPALAAAALLLAVSSFATASDSFSFNAELGVFSSYMWRGVELDDSWSLQPTLTVDYALSDRTSASLNGWWNIALDDHGSSDWGEELFEQDFTLSVEHALDDAWTIGGGYAYVSNPRADIAPGVEAWQTDELFLSLGWTAGSSSVSGAVLRDIDQVDGWWVDLSYALELELAESWTAVAGAHLGFSSGMTETETEAGYYLEDGLVDGNLSAGVVWLLDPLYLSGNFTYWRRFDGWADATGFDDDSMVLAVTVGVDF